LPLALAHFNGTNGAKTFVDEVAGITCEQDVPGQDAELSTAVKKWGLSSLLHPKANGTTGARSGDFTSPHAGNHTLEVWWYRVSGGTNFFNLFGKDSSGDVGVHLLWSGDTGDMSLYLEDSGGSAIVDTAWTQALAADTWHHVAYVREGTSHSAYVDGSRVHTTVSATNVRAFTRIATRGTSNSGVSDNYSDDMNCIDFAKYSGTTYTIPTEEFT